MPDILINSKTKMRHNMYVDIYVPVPDLSFPNAAPAMGESKAEKDENIAKFAEEVLFPQYSRAVKKLIRTYEDSPMPLRYLSGKLEIRPLLLGFYGVLLGETIIIDNNVVIGIVRRAGSGAFTFGHEIGHKILKVKDGKELLETVRSRISTDLYDSNEVVAEVVGEIISGEESELIDMDFKTRKLLQRGVLKLAYS